MGVIPILIVGGGPAGLATAIGLAKKGVAVTVFESRSREELKAQAATEAYDLDGRSYAIALRAKGLGLMKRIDQDAEVSLLERSIVQPKTFMWSGGPEPREVTVAGENIYTTRDTVIGVLLETIENKYSKYVTVEFNRRVTSVVQSGELLTLELKGSGGVQARVVIGSDGVNSPVRAHIMKTTGATLCEYADTPYKFALLPPSATLGKAMHVFTSRGYGNAIVLPFTDGRLSVSLLLHPKQTEVPPSVLSGGAVAAPTDADVSVVKAFVIKHFPPLARVWGDSLEPYRQFFRQGSFPARTIKVGAYAAGNAVVLGDAAHATLPTTGQGLTAALYDAEVLVGMWDGAVETAEPSFARFSLSEAPDRAALFEAGRWVAANRWSVKYLVFMATARPHLALHRAAPWLLGAPLYAAFNNPETRYLEAWQCFERQRKAFPVLLATLATLLLLVVVTLYSTLPDGALGWFGWFVVVLVPGIRSPIHLMSTGKHIAVLSVLGWTLTYTRQDLTSTLFTACLLVYTVRLFGFNVYRRYLPSAAKVTAQEKEELDKIPKGARVPMVLVFALTYCLYMAPLLATRGPPEAIWDARRLLALAVLVGGVVLEAVADHTKTAHKASKGGRSLCTHGVFSYSRHPNYFGEILVWCGWFVGMCPLRPAPVAVSLLALTFKVFSMVKATRRLEKAQCENYLQGTTLNSKTAQHYFTSVPVLVPFTKKYSM